MTCEHIQGVVLKFGLVFLIRFWQLICDLVFRFTFFSLVVSILSKEKDVKIK
jgi:hypothetical protein